MVNLKTQSLVLKYGRHSSHLLYFSIPRKRYEADLGQMLLKFDGLFGLETKNLILNYSFLALIDLMNSEHFGLNCRCFCLKFVRRVFRFLSIWLVKVVLRLFYHVYHTCQQQNQFDSRLELKIDFQYFKQLMSFECIHHFYHQFISVLAFDLLSLECLYLVVLGFQEKIECSHFSDFVLLYLRAIKCLFFNE